MAAPCRLGWVHAGGQPPPCILYPFFFPTSHPPTPYIHVLINLDKERSQGSSSGKILLPLILGCRGVCVLFNLLVLRGLPHPAILLQWKRLWVLFGTLYCPTHDSQGLSALLPAVRTFRKENSFQNAKLIIDLGVGRLLVLSESEWHKSGVAK